jgi:hypothetical protein
MTRHASPRSVDSTTWFVGPSTLSLLHGAAARHGDSANVVSKPRTTRVSLSLATSADMSNVRLPTGKTHDDLQRVAVGFGAEPRPHGVQSEPGCAAIVLFGHARHGPPIFDDLPAGHGRQSRPLDEKPSPHALMALGRPTDELISTSQTRTARWRRSDLSVSSRRSWW